MSDLFNENDLNAMAGGSRYPIVSWGRARVGSVISGVLLQQEDGGDFKLSIESQATDIDGNKLSFPDGRPRLQYALCIQGKPNNWADCSDKFVARATEEGKEDDGKRILICKSFSVKTLTDSIKQFRAEQGRMPVAGDALKMTLTSTTFGNTGKGKSFTIQIAPGTPATVKLAADHLAAINPPTVATDDPWGADSADDSLPPF